MTTHTVNWIELEGAVNVRDVGGLPTEDGRTIRRGVLIRSANLQDLTESDVAQLVDDLGVRRIVDLRTDVEVSNCQPGPMHGQPAVVIRHLSLYPDNGAGETEPQATPDPVLPWHGESFAGTRDPAVAAYLRYLDRRPDSIVAALRAIAEPDGATVVHCAAGKDRTGMVVALALSVAGVAPAVIAADYAQSQSQIGAILAQLSRNGMYKLEVATPADIPPASAAKMLSVLEAIEADFGGVHGWLAAQGWTEADTERLRTALLG
ncbi:MAG: tyrosine-protein phosphatase [Actinomycetota bacterium]|nr:tyrosine-protein phosphatase [Actinomycetota bacterium]MDQ2957019.1 tyrosine-protein phosphatase [Actinomycetota bacterium]